MEIPAKIQIKHLGNLDIMEDVDKVTVKFFHHHPKIWGFGRSPMVFGVWEGVGGGRPFF